MTRGPAAAAADSGGTAPLQTLDRGLSVLEALADAQAPPTTAELAGALGLHRSIVYRLVRTLETHHLVRRRDDGRLELGLGLSTLARNVSRTLQTAALPELAAVANETRMTCFLVVPDGLECVTLVSVEPQHSPATVVQRPGTRHPIDRGAPGLALLAARAPSPQERPEVAAARRDGHARSHSEVIPGLSSLAAPVPATSPNVEAAVCVVYIAGDNDIPAAVTRLRSAADRIAAEL